MILSKLDLGVALEAVGEVCAKCEGYRNGVNCKKCEFKLLKDKLREGVKDESN